MSDDAVGWGQPLKIGAAAFAAAVAGALFSGLITVPVQIAGVEGRSQVQNAELQGKVEAMRSIQAEMREQLKDNLAELARLSTRLTQLEARGKAGARAPQSLEQLRQAQR